MQLQTTLTTIDGALALWRLVDIVSRHRRLPRSVRREARDLGLAVTIVLRRADPVPSAGRLTQTDVASLLGWLIDGLETAGVPRSEIGMAFNRHVLAAPSLPVDLPAGHVLVRTDVLTSLAAGHPLGEAERA